LFHNFPANRESDPVAGIFGTRVQALKNGENFFSILGGYADAVVDN
jgi:hypothetical protein